NRNHEGAAREGLSGVPEEASSSTDYSAKSVMNSVWGTSAPSHDFVSALRTQDTNVSPTSTVGWYQIRRTNSSGTTELETGPSVHAGTDDSRTDATPPGSAPTLTPHFRNTDHLGSLRLVTDSLGNILASYDYYPYGMFRSSSEYSPSSFSYA